MTSETLHSILISGLYAQIQQISDIITPAMNVHSWFFHPHWEMCIIEESAPRETHIKSIIMEYHPMEKEYTVVFRLINNVALASGRQKSLKPALTKVVEQFGFGSFKHLIPGQNELEDALLKYGIRSVCMKCGMSLSVVTVGHMIREGIQNECCKACYMAEEPTVEDKKEMNDELVKMKEEYVQLAKAIKDVEGDINKVKENFESIKDMEEKKESKYELDCDSESEEYLAANPEIMDHATKMIADHASEHKDCLTKRFYFNHHVSPDKETPYILQMHHSFIDVIEAMKKTGDVMTHVFVLQQ